MPDTSPESILRSISLAYHAPDMDRVHQLLSQITDINQPDILGYTVLHHASLLGHIELVEALIKNGIDVNARSYRGTLACDVAAMGGAADPNRHAIFNILLQCGSHRPSFNGEPVNLGFSQNVDSWFGAPEVDGEVRVLPGEGGLCAAPGTMVPVRITAADTYDLVGEVVGAKAMVGEALAARRTSV